MSCCCEDDNDVPEFNFVDENDDQVVWGTRREPNEYEILKVRLAGFYAKDITFVVKPVTDE
jgi:hypothetical protein